MSVCLVFHKVSVFGTSFIFMSLWVEKKSRMMKIQFYVSCDYSSSFLLMIPQSLECDKCSVCYDSQFLCLYFIE